MTCLAISDRPALEECYQGRTEAALKFALTIDDFDDLGDPHHLYDCCGPEPSAFVLKKIAHEEKSRFDLAYLFISLFIIRLSLLKSLKNEPLSLLTPGSKKYKLEEGKDETPAPLSLFGTPSSPTPSLEMMTFYKERLPALNNNNVDNTRNDNVQVSLSQIGNQH